MLGSAELPIAILAWFLVIGIVLTVIGSIVLLVLKHLEIEKIKEAHESGFKKINLRA